MPKSRFSVRALLIGGNVGLVLAAVIAVFAGGAWLLGRLADDLATSRVGLAGVTAAAIVEHSREDVGALARSLAAHPGIAPLVERGDSTALAELLEGYREANRLFGCAIVAGPRLLATSPQPGRQSPSPTSRDPGGQAPATTSRPEIPWEAIVRATQASAAGQLIDTRQQPALVLGAAVEVAGVPEVHAVVVRALDESFAASLSSQIGLPVAVLDRAAASGSSELPESVRELRGRALDYESEAAARVRETGAYQSVQPLRTADGVVVGVLETTLAPAGIARSTRRIVRSLVVLSALIAGLAVVFSILLGRRLVTPLEELTEASARIGRGDLATPVPGRDSTEMGRLANSMEDMRARLMELTDELQRRRAEAEAVLVGIVEGVFAVDRERRIRYVNPQAAGILGLRPEQILGRFCGDVLRPKSEGRVRPCEDRCPILHARFRGSTRAVEHLMVDDGARTVVITSASPEGGDTAGGMQFQVIRDETETEATRRSRDAVLANISHEFRTPLSAQLASIELLRDRLQEIEPREVRELVLALERGALRLTQLIDNLLESVRIESGTDSIRRRPVALDEVVEEAMDLTAPLAVLREQAIEVDLPYPLPGVEGDAPRLVQVFVNLLANASKFAPARSRIRVGGEVREREVLLWVEDEGPGMPVPASGARFERFHRSPGEEPEESGMGLGLFIVKSIVERHGGRVEVLPGSGDGDFRGGTKMCVVLPVVGTA